MTSRFVNKKSQKLFLFAKKGGKYAGVPIHVTKAYALLNLLTEWEKIRCEA